MPFTAHCRLPTAYWRLSTREQLLPMCASSASTATCHRERASYILERSGRYMELP